MTELLLAGCRMQPLSHYLKALGILRLVAEQKDPQARGAWDSRGFVLQSALDLQGLAHFLLEEYRPTPVITPWNGGSGFFAGDNTVGPEAILATEGDRFRMYRACFRAARSSLEQLGLQEKPNTKQKPVLLHHLRSTLPDACLPWLDAALSLGTDKPQYPPLLGTGGNDGRLDFANNFMQRVAHTIISETRTPHAAAWLEAALTDGAVPNLQKSAIGQFNPSAAGGANANSLVFNRDSSINPWDFVLMIEGAIAFASASTRRLESTRGGAMAYPFMVRSSGAGYASAAHSDEQSSNTRDEIWLPEWRQPASWSEIRALFREGRATVAGRAARSGVDFARALSTLGVSRGITAFHRYAFLVRNGLSYQAVPLGRWKVQAKPDADLISPELDQWLDRLRRAAREAHAPGSWSRAVRTIDERLLSLLRSPGPQRVQSLLIAIADAERAIMKNPRRTDEKRLRPVPWLSAAWLERADDKSDWFRIVAALASTGLRHRMAPVDMARTRHLTWRASLDGRGQVTWRDGSLSDNLVRLLLREEVERRSNRVDTMATSAWRPAAPRWRLGLSDVAAFVDAERVPPHYDDLVRGLALISPARFPTRSPGARKDRLPPLVWALCFCARSPNIGGGTHATAGMIRRLASGDAAGASKLALRRLNSLERRPVILTGRTYNRAWDGIAEPRAVAQRAAAALALPLSSHAHAALVARVFEQHTTNSHEKEST